MGIRAECVCVVAYPPPAFLLPSVNKTTAKPTHCARHVRCRYITHTRSCPETATRKVISRRPDCSLQLFHTDQTPAIRPSNLLQLREAHRCFFFLCCSCKMEQRRRETKEETDHIIFTVPLSPLLAELTCSNVSTYINNPETVSSQVKVGTRLHTN